MKKAAQIMCAGIFIVSGLGSAEGAWMDNFNNYTGADVVLDNTNSTPWAFNGSTLSTRDDGSGGYCVGAASGGRSGMSRATDPGDTTLTFNFKLLGLDQGSAEIAMSQTGTLHPDYSIANPPYIGLEIDARWDGQGRYDMLEFVARNSDWSRASTWDLRDAGLVANVWYDGKMALAGSTVTYGYKLASDVTWTESAGNAVPAGFVFNYVTASEYQDWDTGALLDNIGTVPEPATTGLLLLGSGILVRRKK